MILFLRGGALGDFVLTLPVLATLFATGRRVDVACARRHRTLVRRVGEPGRFWDIDGGESTWMFGGVDPVGYAMAVSFTEARSDLPVTEHLRVAARPPLGVEAWRHFASVLPSEFACVNPGLVLPAPPLRADAPVVLAPGASDPTRSWPLARWFGLAERLREQAPVVVVGGPAEAWAEYRPDLDELMALAGGAGAWLGPDSGPGHLAARCGAPTFTVFGPTDRAWAPYGAAILDSDVSDDAVVAMLLDARSRRFGGVPPGLRTPST